MIERVSFLCFSSGILNELTLFLVFSFSGQMQTLLTTITTSPNLLFFMKCC